MKISDLAKADHKYIPTNPEPGFNPAWNKKVIEGTIKKNEQLRAFKQRIFKDKLRERTDAVACFLTSGKTFDKPNDVVKYFGKRELARLRGEKIIEKIKKLKDGTLIKTLDMLN